jgi:hypothetical protein
MLMEIHAITGDRHTNMVGLNQLMDPNTPLLII